MSKLTWLIYLSQIIDDLSVVEIIFTFIFTIVALIFVGITLAMYFNDEQDDRHYPVIKWTGRIMLPYAIFCMFVCAATPSQQTILLMVSSQYASDLVNNPKFQNDLLDPGLKMLQTWIANETATLQSQASGGH